MKQPKQTILIVEDEDVLRQAYMTILKQEGYQVHEAPNGKVALGKLDEVKPDLIILDILMPVMDGLTFLQQAKLADRTHKPKVLAFSNLSDQEKLDQTTALGATQHTLKSSLSPKQLVATVKGLLK